MKILIFSDIHSNLEALEVLEKEIKKRRPDKIICLGDIVGYGADPEECIKRVKNLRCEVIAGNHDWACCGGLSLEYFNPFAKEAILWTRDNIDKIEETYLRELPLIYKEKSSIFVHGSLFDPQQFYYLDNYQALIRDFSLMDRNILFVGHTHIPAVFLYKNDNLFRVCREEIEINSKYKYIINVGSIGQPRDRDPRLCFCEFYEDKNIVKFIRLDYNIKKAKEKILSKGLPPLLGERLEFGW